MDHREILVPDYRTTQYGAVQHYAGSRTFTKHLQLYIHGFEILDAKRKQKGQEYKSDMAFKCSWLQLQAAIRERETQDESV